MDTTPISTPVGAPDQAAAIGIVFVLAILLVAFLITLLMVWIYCKIFSKAGYSWALGLLMIVPFGNIIIPLILAFGDWPIHQELRRLKQQQPQVH